MTPKQLKKLQDKWYKKLKDSGFKDIEDTKNYVGQRSGPNLKSYNINQIHAIEYYNELADRLLREYEFERPLHRVIWEYHVNGLPGRTIADILSKTKIPGAKRSNISRIIKILENKMKELYLK